MTSINDVDPVRVLEDNKVAFLLALGRAGGGTERDDTTATWTIGGSPIAYHNAVVRADLPPEFVEDVIVQSQSVMSDLGVPGSWHVGPSMRPSDLTDTLRFHGFAGGPEPGMIADLNEMPELEPVEGLHIEAVVDEAGLAQYEGVLSQGFGEGPTEAAWVREMYSRIGLGEYVLWRHYVGALDDTPVATATVFFAADVAGLYFVSTLPAFRGRGIGAAISRTALVAARDLGYGVGVLGSSPMGKRVYERLGFRELCSIEVLEWGTGAR